ncbi:unnamed protein product [Camellia sinensis]
MQSETPVSIWVSADSFTPPWPVPSVVSFSSGSPVTRWASVALGAGVGIGSAYTECSYKFDEKLTISKISDPASQGWTGLRLEFECANSLRLGFGRTDNNVGARKNNVTAKQQHGRLTVG